VDKRYELQGLQLMDVSDADFEARFVSELIEYMNSTDNENRTEEIADIIIQGYTLLKKKGLNPEKIIISKLRKNLHKPL
jgi:phosphoribosyl-ATP pyrophosphohydrolase